MTSNKYPFPEFIDNSSRSSFVACPKKGYYSYIRKLRKNGSSIHLIFGGALAKGLEVFRLAYYGEKVGMVSAYAKGVEAIIKEWGDNESDHEQVKNLGSCLLAFESYLQQYPPAEDIIKPYNFPTGPAVEFTFAVPIPDVLHPVTGNPMLYTGRFDMLGEYNGGLYVVDEKTTSMLGNSWAQQFRLSSQMSGYVWAAKQFGYPVNGAVIRGVGIYKSYFGHAMVIEQRPQWMVDRWYKQLCNDLRQMIEMWKNDDWSYNLDSSCASYGGCQYLELCTHAEPEKWIEPYYHEHHWNPLDKLQ